MANTYEITSWETKIYAAPALAKLKERGEITLADLAKELNANPRHILATLAALEKSKVCKLGKKDGRYFLR